MYYPYLTGRQYELLALKELVEKEAISPLIIPIIKPVKASSTLCNTLQTFVEKDRKVITVWYPSTDEFRKDLIKLKKGQESQKIIARIRAAISNPQINKAVEITDKNQSVILKQEKENGFSRTDWVTICTNYDMLSVYNSLYQDKQPLYAVIPNDSAFLRRVIRTENKIMIQDRFNKQSRNADYIENTDEFFSEDHLYFLEERFKGFSDYSIVGNIETTSGFAPKAVAIHIVYIDKKNNALRIHHFVSDSNDDIQNTAKKFYEAVTKLVNWVRAESPEMTLGLKEFVNHYDNGTYPGLGVVKKLSIMHHLELVSNHLTTSGWTK